MAISPDEFDRLVKEYDQKIQIWLQVNLGLDESTAADVVQSTWKKVWELRESADPTQSVSAWAFRIAINQAKTWHRDNKRTVPSNHLVQEVLAEDSCNARHGEMPEAMQQSLERVRRVIYMLLQTRQLTEKDELILSAYCSRQGQQWVTAELEAETGMNGQNIRARRIRIISKIKKEVDGSDSEYQEE